MYIFQPLPFDVQAASEELNCLLLVYIYIVIYFLFIYIYFCLYISQPLPYDLQAASEELNCLLLVWQLGLVPPEDGGAGGGTLVPSQVTN